MSDLELQMNGFRLTTAQIFYHLPDNPALLQEYLWQKLDLAPKFPELTQFLQFWTNELDGKLHSVYVAKKELISPADLEIIDTEFTLQ